LIIDVIASPLTAACRPLCHLCKLVRCGVARLGIARLVS